MTAEAHAPADPEPPEPPEDARPSDPVVSRPPSPSDRTADPSGPVAAPVPAPTRRYVVAIGASAGGLDALEKLFAALPADCGASFVVIQHLSPDHKSMMASLLARHTRMPVIMVEDDMPIEANQVYLIPPGAIMHLDGRHLRLTPKSPRALTLPIDVFFQSLASHYGDQSVAVVLSGTGSDGTRGAGAINEAGGLLIAQEPDTAKFDGMPRSVIATGLVDAILPVERIAQRIVAHVTHQAGAAADEGPLPLHYQGGPESAMAGIVHLLQQVGGINFEDYKPGTVRRRIERRMAVRQIASLESYLMALQQDRAELLTLKRELLIPVTSFFRDTEAYESLLRLVVDPIVSAKEAGQPIRVWCAGVATGEEAYSIAMLFLEAFEQARRWPTLKIFATDVEQVNVESAAAGTYPESIVAEVSGPQLERFFAKRGAQFVVKNELRQCIVFARHNLLTDPPFTRMDLVVCRNTLIYFRSEAQDRVLRRLQYALAPKGFLFLGSSESLGVAQTDFQTLSARHKIWQVTRSTPLPLDAARAAHPLYGGPARPRLPAPGPATRLGQGGVEQGYATLLRAFAPPPAVLINARHELVHAFGEVRRFLAMREGQLSLDLNRMLPDPLVPVAAALLFKVARENAGAIAEVVRLSLPGELVSGDEPAPRRFVRLSAWPVGEAEGERLTLLAFEEVNPAERGDRPATLDIDTATTERLEMLEHELAATRESLQATIEELETSNEELQATNEEMMASNEELQSSNEELQSVNEELNTVNAEYQEKIDILNRLNADLDSLAKVVSSGTVFVDERLHLTRFSADATQVFRLRESDLGRPLSDLTHTLDYPGFMTDLAHSLEQAQPLEREAADVQGRRYLVKMQPYRVPSSSARGVVVSFVDMTSMHRAHHLQDVLDALGAQVAVLDRHGVIQKVNAAWTRFAQAHGEVALSHCGVGASYLDVCRADVPGPDAGFARRAAEGLQRVLDGRLEHFSMEYPCHSATEERWFVMHANPLRQQEGGAVVSHVNISAWRRGGEDGEAA